VGRKTTGEPANANRRDRICQKMVRLFAGGKPVAHFYGDVSRSGESVWLSQTKLVRQKKHGPPPPHPARPEKTVKEFQPSKKTQPRGDRRTRGPKEEKTRKKPKSLERTDQTVFPEDKRGRLYFLFGYRRILHASQHWLETLRSRRFFFSQL